MAEQELETAYDYAVVFYTDETLRENESYTLQLGSASQTLSAIR